MLLAGTSQAALADDLLLPSPSSLRSPRPPRRFDLHNAVYFGLFMGLVAFSTTTSLLLMCERRRAGRAERRLRNELAALRGADDLAALLMGSERQLLVSWNGRDGEPRFQGDPTIVGESAPAQRALAFGTWLVPAMPPPWRAPSSTLKERGQAFRLTARCLGSRFIDVEGRTIGGRAILRLRDVTGDRSELLQAQAKLSTRAATCAR